jgi:hypothetical protein
MHSLPEGGSFVVFTVDFLASIAHLDNTELASAIKELGLGQNKYVAFVITVR